jgi:hypothetical protein
MKVLEHQKLKQLSLWVKENAKAINVFAGVFFALTFISGIFWMFGANIESVAFVLSLCASSLFGLPHAAEFILPDRKPIKDMTHDELLQFVKYSDPKKDWKGISKNWVSEVFLKEDPRLRFRAKFTEEGIQNDDYKDEWANDHFHQKAVGYWYDLFYDGNLIDRFILVAVDEARASLPPPYGKTEKIHMMEYKVAQIHDTLGTLDEYIVLSGLEVDDNT